MTTALQHLLLLVVALLAACGPAANAVPSPFTSVPVSTVITSADTTYTCNPMSNGSPGGQGNGACEIVNVPTSTVYAQTESTWPSATSGIYPFGPQQFFNKLLAPDTCIAPYPPKTWIPNPTGQIRYTTFTRQCFWASPGCLSTLTPTLDVAEKCATNSVGWLMLASSATGKQGTCVVVADGSPVNCPGAPPAGTVKITPISKCGNLYWDGSVAVAILTDSAGNQYVQHAYSVAGGYTPYPGPAAPVPAMYPRDWTLSTLSGPMAITTLRPNNMCAAGSNDPANPYSNYLGDNNNVAGTVGCLAVIVTDAAGNGFHRFYHSGQEPVELFNSNNPGATTRPDSCKAQCNFRAYAAPAYKAKITRTLSVPGAFKITLKRLSAKVATYMQPLPGGFDPQGKYMGKGFTQNPVAAADTDLAAFLLGASDATPIKGALVVRAPGYQVYDPLASQSLATPTGDDSTVVPDQEDLTDDPEVNQPSAPLDPGETADDETTVEQDMSSGVPMVPKTLAITITKAEYFSATRKLKVTIQTDSIVMQSMLQQILDVEIGTNHDPLKLKRKVELFKPILWVIDKP